MIRKVFPIVASGKGLGPRQVRVVCSTGVVDRAGEVIEQAGIDLADFSANPIVLWSHLPEHPVGTVGEIGIKGGNLQALVDFAPEGASEKADEVCRLVKGGIIKSVSVGFDPIEMEPMNPARPRGPQRYMRSKLLELSFVAIPCNPDAVVVERGKPSQSGASPSRAQRHRQAEALALTHCDADFDPYSPRMRQRAARLLDPHSYESRQREAMSLARRP